MNPTQMCVCAIYMQIFRREAEHEVSDVFLNDIFVGIFICPFAS